MIKFVHVQSAGIDAFTWAEQLTVFDTLCRQLLPHAQLRVITVVKLDLVSPDGAHRVITGRTDPMWPLVRLAYFYYWSTARQEQLRVFANMARFREGNPPDLDGECARFAAADIEHNEHPLLSAICFACGMEREAAEKLPGKLAARQPQFALGMALDAAQAYLERGNHLFSDELIQRMVRAVWS